jgi:hypothetical protein
MVPQTILILTMPMPRLKTAPQLTTPPSDTPSPVMLRLLNSWLIVVSASIIILPFDLIFLMHMLWTSSSLHQTQISFTALPQLQRALPSSRLSVLHTNLVALEYILSILQRDFKCLPICLGFCALRHKGISVSRYVTSDM